MSLNFSNAIEIFIFIIFCSIYVCSILWIYGDAATRDMGLQGAILPLIFTLAAATALIENIAWPLALWPLGFIAWFIFRPRAAHAIVSE